MANEEALRLENEKLKAENMRLARANEDLRAQRKELTELLIGPPELLGPTDEEIEQGMKDAIPLSQFFVEIGLMRPAESVS